MAVHTDLLRPADIPTSMNGASITYAVSPAQNMLIFAAH